MKEGQGIKRSTSLEVRSESTKKDERYTETIENKTVEILTFLEQVTVKFMDKRQRLVNQINRFTEFEDPLTGELLKLESIDTPIGLFRIGKNLDNALALLSDLSERITTLEDISDHLDKV